MISVAVGQTWSVLFGCRHVEFRIDEIVLHGGARRARGPSVRTGRTVEVNAATMEKGWRAARLVKHVDGTPYQKPKVVYAPTKETERKPARVYQPRGLHVSSLDEAVSALRACGFTAETIAERVGVRKETVIRSLNRIDDRDTLARTRSI